MQTNDRTDKSAAPKCAQCGSKEPEKGFRTAVVIHRGFDHVRQKQVMQESRFTVCNGTPCGAHLQMGYEG